MKRSKLQLLIMGLCVLTVTLASQAVAVAANITGIVTRYHDELPLAGATVSLGNVSTLTDRHGAFSFTDLHLGSHIVTVQLGERAIHMQPIVVRAQEDTINLVVDTKDGVLFEDGFEQLTNDTLGSWTPYSSYTSGTVTTTNVKSGKQSFYIDAPDDNRARGIRSVKIPVVPGKTYAATFWMMLTSGSTNLFFECFDVNDKQIARHNYAVKTIDADWREVTLTVTAPENAASIGMLFYFNKPAVGTLYVDDVRIYEVR